MDDDAIRALLIRLSRPDASGGDVIERAAILAAGSDFTEIMAWVMAHGGKAEMPAAAASSGGLHGARITAGGADQAAVPLRFVLPPGVLGKASTSPP